MAKVKYKVVDYLRGIVVAEGVILPSARDAAAECERKHGTWDPLLLVSQYGREWRPAPKELLWET